YPETALRPMHDLDFLLPPGDFVRGFDWLTAHGWKPLRGTREGYLKRLRTFHALPVMGPDGVEIDLHRHMLEENCSTGADKRLLERVRTAEVDGLTVTVPSAEDQVINACVHGVRWDPVPPLRWLLDAVMVLRATEAFDWEYLEAESQERGVGLAMAAALEFARDFEPSIPGETISRLRAGKHSRLERFDFRFQQGGYSAPVQVGRYATRYLRLSNGRSSWRRTAEFPTYLAAMWEIEDARKVPAEGVKRVWKAVRR
ncbi:MAG: nucleotidyltransferase family protein, partial [bacterium]